MSGTTKDEALRPVRLAERLQVRGGEAVTRLVDAIASEIPYYAALAPATLRGEVADVCRRNLVAYLRCAREGRAPSEAELDEVRGPVAQRAEEGVPLDAVLLAWEVGNRVTWEVMCEQAGPEDLQDVLDATRHLRLFLHAYVGAVSATYVAEREAIDREAGGGLARLAEQLLAGRVPSAHGQRPGLRLADTYVVCAVALGVNAEERGGGPSSTMAARRKLRRVHAGLDEVIGAPVLSTLTGRGGTVLFPVWDERPFDMARLREVVVDLAQWAGAPVSAAASCPTPLPGLPAAAALADDLLELATALSLPPQLYLLDDLLLELPLLHSPLARARLAGLLAPTEAVPELLPTLRAWLSHDRNRRDTADALYVHRNTLDRRLERVTALTGLDLSTARGIALAQAAVCARAIERSRAGRSVGAGG